MTNHLKYIDVREYARVVDIARELIERAEQAEAAVQRVRDVLDEWDDLVIDGEDPEEHIIRALDDNKGVNND